MNKRMKKKDISKMVKKEFGGVKDAMYDYKNKRQGKRHRTIIKQRIRDLQEKELKECTGGYFKPIIVEEMFKSILKMK